MNQKFLGKTFSAVVTFCAIAMCGCEQPTVQNKETEKSPQQEHRRGWFKKKKQKALIVVIENLGEGSGPVRLGVYGPGNNFPDKDDKLTSYQLFPENGKIEALIDDLDYGEFAIAAYHDINNNSEIDKNQIGIPTEPYGFSNGFKPLLKAPEFKDCSFKYNEKSNRIVISLNAKKEENPNEKSN